MTKGQQKSAAKIAITPICQGVTVCLLLLASVAATCREVNDHTVLYIEETKLPFHTMLDKISTSTGYKIELVGEWPEVTVNARMQGLPLEAGLKRIIKEMGSISHALVLDTATKKIKIVKFQEGQDARVTNVSPKMQEDGEINVESSSRIVDEVISPPSPDGKPGLTRNRLTEIKSEHSAQLRSINGNTELSPPSEYGPGLTLTEIEKLKSEYGITLEEQNESLIITTPSVHGKGLSKGEVETIKELHRKQLETAGQDTVITQESKYGPGLTLGDLEKIKSTHAGISTADDTLITPPSEYGVGLSIQEVNQIKATHRQNTTYKKQ
jgi:hypothetical protein